MNLVIDNCIKKYNIMTPQMTWLTINDIEEFIRKQEVRKTSIQYRITFEHNLLENIN